MKKFGLLILLIFCISKSYSQVSIKKEKSIGMSFGTATSGIIDTDIFYKIKNSRFHLGYSYQFNSAKGDYVTERKSNYGTTQNGSGDYFTSINLSYSHIIYKKITIKGEFSIASKKYYTSYIDNRFTSGGYYLIDKSLSTVGYGIDLGYFVSPKIELYGGYNSIKQVTFGLRFKIIDI